MAKQLNEPSHAPGDLLTLAQAQTVKMWEDCAEISGGQLQRASVNDTIHFLHEEASEVVKCAMRMGLVGDKPYVRSSETMAAEYNWQTLIGEIGDVLLMALTLAVAFDVNASVCLNATMEKFYARARAQALGEACTERTAPPVTKVIPREDW